MDCFLKHIEHYDDPGVQGLRGDRFVPFTVLGFSGFNDPPSPKEAQFLIDVTFELAAPRNTLVVCRNALPDEERFVDDAEGVLRRVLRNWSVAIAERRGVSPSELARRYNRSQSV